jgi:sulfur-oxidizing protein SoxA
MRAGIIVAVVVVGVLSLASVARSDEGGDTAKYIVGNEKSGYVYASPETRAMEDDDFSNPGFLWVERGKALWNTPDGTSHKSCESCHGAAETSMKGVGAAYPKYVASAGKVLDIEQRINQERTMRMGAAAFPWESRDLLALTAYVKLQSRGMPVAVTTDGPAHAAWVEGKRFYTTRRGQLDMSCEQCHVQNNNNHLRTETLSQGQINGFPTYRLSWQSLGSAQRRFRECNQQIRAQPLPYGSQEYVDLELYVASLGQGLPVETPAVRK